jgi:uncharacterized short protein YbdD (DUF466 family)
MICNCFGKTLDLRKLGSGAGKAARLMLGVPDYEAYAAHMRATHPDSAVMSREAFLRERQAARFGNGGLRCC